MTVSWRGGGRFRFWTDQSVFLIHFNQLTTRTSKFQDDIGDFFRKNARDIRPKFGPFQVKIWMEHLETDPRIDVDNVAKACLDCLTKVVWQDDRQVKRLSVEKFQGTCDQVYMRVDPLEELPDGKDLKSLLDQL